MRLLVLAALLFVGCRTAPTPVAAPPAQPAGWYEVAAQSGTVERMHPDGADWLALVESGGVWTLLRLRRDAAGEWKVVERTPSTEYYLWPAQ